MEEEQLSCVENMDVSKEKCSNEVNCTEEDCKLGEVGTKLSANIASLTKSQDTSLNSKSNDDNQATLCNGLSDDEVKPRRKSKLSLNSEGKTKSKFKEDSSQSSIISFFQKMSPNTPDNSRHINKSEKDLYGSDIKNEKSSTNKDSLNNCTENLTKQEERQYLNDDLNSDLCNGKTIKAGKESEVGQSSSDGEFKKDELQLKKKEHKLTKVKSKKKKSTNSTGNIFIKSTEQVEENISQSKKHKKTSETEFESTEGTVVKLLNSKVVSDDISSNSREKEKLKSTKIEKKQRKSALKKASKKKSRENSIGSIGDEELTKSKGKSKANSEKSHSKPKKEVKEAAESKFEPQEERERKKTKSAEKTFKVEEEELIKSVKRNHSIREKNTNDNKDTRNGREVSSNSEEKKKGKSAKINCNIEEGFESDEVAANSEVFKQAKKDSAKAKQTENSDTKESRKVRFSEEIREFSPEPIRKNGASAEVPQKQSEKISEDSPECANISEDSNENEEPSKSEVKNAFTFMMKSRYKSIGQNSPGKEAEKSDESPAVLKEAKTKLSARKAIFQDWADAKGGKKRKIDYEEKGNIIEKKLKKRARRLKKMLTQEQSLNESEGKNEVMRKKHKVVRIIESDSENTHDSVIEQNKGKPKTKNQPEKVRHKSKKRKRLSSDANSQQENDDVIFVKYKKPKFPPEMSGSSCLAIEEAPDLVLNGKKSNSNPTTPLQQTALSNFFEVINRSNNSVPAKSKLQLKTEAEDSKKKKNKSKSKLQLKPEAEDSKKKKNKSKSKLTLKKDINNTSISDDFSKSPIEMKNARKKDNSLNKSVEIDCSEEQSIEEVESLDEVSEMIAKKTQIQMVLTPRTVQKWKMRLKVKLAEEGDAAIEKLLQSQYVDAKSKSEDEQEIVKTKKKMKVLESSDSDSDEPLASRLYHKEKANRSGRSAKLHPVKLAPLFIKAKAKPKPKLDEATIEARKKFLHSDLPESFKKVIEKQQRVEEIEYEIFPSISHITVKPTDEQLANCNINFWNLPGANLNFTSYQAYCPNIGSLRLGSFTNANAKNDSALELQALPKVVKFRTILKIIKSENPDYPVYKAFKFLHQKHSKNSGQQTTQELTAEVVQPPAKVRRSRGRPKKKVQTLNDDSVKIVEVNKPEISEQQSYRQELWTDMYKPCTSEEIFGNHASISQLKTWLETWLEYSAEMNMHRSRRKHRNSDSSSDFDSVDAQSRDSSRFPENTTILCGPYGSGKTSTIYALCCELGVNVLELNASSKRTGKRLLLELQEATQSHQVRKKDSLTLFLKKDEAAISQSSNSQSSDSQSSTSDKKMCLLLIEDVDIVFEQDETFISALGQLLTMSKRPIVLTTTDTNCLHLKKFFMQYPIIKFRPLSAKILATWLQVLCLVEGSYVDRRAIAELLERNEGDVRCTLLQLQFWVQSGGQLRITEALPTHAPNTDLGKFGIDETLYKDESSNISWLNEEESAEQSGDANAKHCNAPDSFRYFKDCNGLYNSLPLDLGSVWWNLSNMFRIPQPLEVVNAKIKIHENEDLHSSSNSKDKKVEFQNLKNLVNIFETLAVTDVLYEKSAIDCDLEPVHRIMNRVKNSLELNESMENYNTIRNLTCELSHKMLDNYINRSDATSSSFNYMAFDEKLWRTKQNKCKETLLGAIPILCHLDHKPVNMDYFSALRTMARSETIRANINSKRGNRFYNYLRGLGISCKDSFFKTACSVFCRES